MIIAFLIFFDYWKIETKNFRIYYHKDFEIVAHKVADISEEVLEELQGYLSPLGEKINIVILSVDDVIGGFASFPQNTIYINIGDKRADSLFLPSGDTLRGLISHELAHILSINIPCVEGINKIFGGFLRSNAYTPRFIHEGFAEFIEEKIEKSYEINIKPKDIKEIIGNPMNFPYEAFHYIGGKKFFSFLEEKYGYSKIREFFVRNSCYFPYLWFSSYRKTFGRDFREDYEDWKIKEKIEEENLEMKIIEKKEDITDFEIVGDGRFANFFGDKMLFVSDGKIFLGKNEIAEKNGSYWVHTDGNLIVWDSKEQGKYSIYIYDGKIKKLKEESAHYPVSHNGRIYFVKKEKDRDKLCYIEKEEKNCFFSSSEFERIYTPDVSGNKIVFSILRNNGDVDIALYENGSLKFITQDRWIDIFPYFYGDSIIFSSNREGIFSIYAYQDGKFFKLVNVLGGAYESRIKDGNIYFTTFTETGPKISKARFGVIKSLDVLPSPTQRIEKISEIEKKEKVFIPRTYLFFLPSAYISSIRGGLFLNFYISDILYFNNIFLGIGGDFVSNINVGIIDEKKEKANEIVNRLPPFSPSIDFRYLIRYFKPYFLFSLNYSVEPIFNVKDIGREGEIHYYFGEKDFSFEGNLVFPVRNVIFLQGLKFVSFVGEIEGGDTSFWNFVRKKYEEFGKGNFISPQFGFILRTTRRGIYLEGSDLRILTEYIRGIDEENNNMEGINLKYFGRFYNRFGIVTLGKEFSGFISSAPRRFKPFVGSQPLPIYPDSPLDPLTPFDIKFYGFGDIKGFIPQRSNFSFILTLKPILSKSLGIGYWKIPIFVKYLHLIPFISSGVRLDKFEKNFLSSLVSEKGFLLSIGSEVDIDTTISFYLPMTIKFGFARGIYGEKKLSGLGEFYISIFSTVGSIR